MGQDKIPRYSHRLMHRKRVTCELHDSYFRSMTIKHVIPRIAEVKHPGGQLWGDIEWGIELLYNSVKTGSQLVWTPNPLVTRCGRESQHSAASWSPRPPVEHQENKKDTTLMAIRMGVNMLQFCSVSNSLSHTNLSNKVRGTYFSKRLCRSSSLCRRYDSVYTCRCIVAYGLAKANSALSSLYKWGWNSKHL